MTTTYSDNTKYSAVTWREDDNRIFIFRVPDGHLESFLRVLEFSNVDLAKVKVNFFGPRG
jgi:hypothetical protein